MGEIADALKRARDQHASTKPARPGRSSGEYTAALKRADEEATDSEGAPPLESAARPDAEAREPERAPAHISRERGANFQARAVLVDAQGAGAEAYRHFAVRVRRALQARGAHSVMIISALRREGKTTTACNLSLALASLSTERTTALIDFDLRRPSVASYLGTGVGVGIESVLRGQASVGDVRVPTEFENLDVYPVSHAEGQPHEMLYGRRFADLVQQLEKSYDTVVIDSPPVLMAPDVEIMLPHVGACVTVFNSRNTRVAAFRQMLERIPEGKLLGSFINRTRRRNTKYYYGTYTPRNPEAKLDPGSEQQ